MFACANSQFVYNKNKCDDDLEIKNSILVKNRTPQDQEHIFGEKHANIHRTCFTHISIALYMNVT